MLQEEEQIDDIDKENLGDPAQAAVYAMDIFHYYKEREVGSSHIYRIQHIKHSRTPLYKRLIDARFENIDKKIQSWVWVS